MGTTFKRGNKWGISYIDPNGFQVRKVVAPFKETAEKILSKMGLLRNQPNLIESSIFISRR